MNRRDNHLRDTPKLPDRPYKGLMPYSEEDAPFFFGREPEREIITANLLASRLTLLYGACGVGKSSVLRAGVSHHLRQLAYQNLATRGTPEFAVVVFSSWRDDPLAGLADRVRDSVAQALNVHVEALEPVPPSYTLTQILQAWAERVGGDLFIVLDQFEQYFLYHSQEDGEGTFAFEFSRGVNRPDLRASFLVSIREDSLAKLDRFKGHIPDLFDNYLRIEHLDREAARAAIERPIWKYNDLLGAEVRVEPALVEEVLKQVKTGQVHLGEAGRGVVRADTRPALAEERIEAPYLQLVMTHLWDEEMHAESDTLRLETLERLGGAERIVRTHLDEAMSVLTLSEQKAAARIFHHLVTPTGTKIAHTIPDLAEYAKLRQAQLTSVLDRLSHPAIRILRPVTPPPGQPTAPRYEIFHDVLAPAILDWRARYREIRRLGSLAAILVMVVAFLAVGVAMFAQRQKIESERLRFVSSAQALAAQATLQQEQLKQDERAALLARQAYLFNHQSQGQILYQVDDALRTVLGASYFSFILQGHMDGVQSVAFSPDSQTLASGGADGTVRLWNLRQPTADRDILHGHEADVMSVAFSPDGQTLASGSADGTVRLWNLRQLSAAPTVLRGHEESVLSVAFSPNGQTLASGIADGTVHLWDLGQPRTTPTILRGHEAEVWTVVFSPDGQTLASGSADGTVRLWNLRQPSVAPNVLRGHEASVRSVAFSPNGQTLASGSSDQLGRTGTVRLWDLQQPSADPTVLPDHEAGAWAVAFSPDGQSLASGSADGTIRLWNLRQPTADPDVLRGHEAGATSVAFSPDGQTLASGSLDETVRLWDLRQPSAAPTVLRSHEESVWSVTFSPNGQTLASGSSDQLGRTGTVRLWDLQQPSADPTVLPDHEAGAWAVAFSPDGQTLASGSADRTVRLWNLRQPTADPDVLRGHEADVTSVAFSPDGQTLASGSADGTIRLWNLRQPTADPDVLRGHEAGTISVAFSPDGQTLASGSADGIVRLWDLRRPSTEPTVLPGHGADVTSVAFSPNGQTLASGSLDETVRLWDPRQPSATPSVLHSHEGSVWSVAFGPDSQTLASGSADGTVHLWDLGQPSTAPIVLRGHEDRVLSVGFSPDGQMLASGSADQTIRIWIARTEILADMVCEKVWRNLTLDEWRRFVGKDIPYARTCPDLPPAPQVSVDAFLITKGESPTATVKPGMTITTTIEEVVRIRVEVSVTGQKQEEDLLFTWYTCGEGYGPVLQRIGSSEMLYVAPSAPGPDCIRVVFEKEGVELGRNEIFVDVQEEL